MYMLKETLFFCFLGGFFGGISVYQYKILFGVKKKKCLGIIFKYLLVHLLLSKSTCETWKTRFFLRLSQRKIDYSSWTIQHWDYICMEIILFITEECTQSLQAWLSICVLIWSSSNFSTRLGWTVCESVFLENWLFPTNTPLFLSSCCGLKPFSFNSFMSVLFTLPKGLHQALPVHLICLTLLES